MYKLVIVDDDAILRRGLITVINWNSMDIEVAGDADDGEAGLQLIEEIKPDVVITDINMPYVNGLDLVGRLSDILPCSKVIILSGYDIFDYAQAALRNKVFDYLLKPVKEEILVASVKKAIQAIEDEKKRILNESELRRQLKESLPVLREKYLEYVVNGRIKLGEVLNRGFGFEMSLDCSRVIVLVLDMNNFDEKGNYAELHLKLLGIRKIIKENFKENAYFEILENQIGQLTILTNYQQGFSEKDIIKNLTNISEKILNFIESYFQVRAFIGIGMPYEDVNNVHLSYKEALETLEYRIILKDTRVMYYGDICKGTGSPSLEYPLEIEEQILIALKQGDIEKVTETASAFVMVFLNKNQASPAQLKRGCLQLVYSVIRKLVELNIDIDSIELKSESIEQKLRRGVTADELEALVVAFIKSAANTVHRLKSDVNRSVIKQAYNYMEAHYGENIGLADIASSVYLTPNYFAVFFKNETDKTVLTYLTELRMEKAKSLLGNQNLKNYEVAEKVGYKDVKYFVKTFKKHYGMTPAEYKESKRGT